MKAMKLTLLSALAFGLTGCASMAKWQDYFANERQEAKAEYEQSTAKEAEKATHQHARIVNQAPSSDYFQAMRVDMQPQKRKAQNPHIRHTNINHYVRGLMQNMVNNLEHGSEKTPMAVASFVYLDSSYQQGTLLGNQIAESMMHELHQFGIPVIDFKTTDYLRVSPSGDFIFSRDYLDLSPNAAMQYIVAGTLVRHQKGVLVNARIVGLKSKAIVASAQTLIPQSVVSDLLSTDRVDGIELSAN